MPSVAAAPEISIKVPQFELVLAEARLAVPLDLMLPLDMGRPTVGRTRMFCQVMLSKVLPLLLLVTVKVSWLVVTEVTANVVPLLAALLMLTDPMPPAFWMNTVGAVPPVSKMKPAGGLRLMVPVPTWPPTVSV